ncbi:hypothetical protein [Bradyrhizobium sp. RDM4]|uniref:hypothetical protein n=1 Tax=Bradyrhizobium sp. RDM4 TaxID=3378765 RepID=UPI0038FC8D87
MATPDCPAPQYVRKTWNDEVAEALTRAAVAQATQETSGLPLVTKADILPVIAPDSAAVRLFARCPRFSLDGVYDVAVPRGVPDTLPPFVGEGKPAPNIRVTFADSKVGPTRKILVTSAVTAELENASAETASDVIGHIIDVDAKRRLDGVVFDDLAADDVRPEGLLHGLLALTASAGTGLEAISEDLGNIAGAVGDAGVATNGMIIVANSRQAARLTVLSPNYDESRVFGSPQIPAGRVIGISLDAVASGYSGNPIIEKSREAAIHFEDTAPTDIGIVGSPNVVAAPVRSAFQTDMIAIKVRCNAAWKRIAPGVAFIDDVNW